MEKDVEELLNQEGIPEFSDELKEELGLHEEESIVEEIVPDVVEEVSEVEEVEEEVTDVVDSEVEEV